MKSSSGLTHAWLRDDKELVDVHEADEFVSGGVLQEARVISKPLHRIVMDFRILVETTKGSRNYLASMLHLMLHLNPAKSGPTQWLTCAVF